MTEQQIAPASANREYNPTPLSFGSAFAFWIVASSLADPVEVVGEAISIDACERDQAGLERKLVQGNEFIRPGKIATAFDVFTNGSGGHFSSAKEVAVLIDPRAADKFSKPRDSGLGPETGLLPNQKHPPQHVVA